jgi:hypothetical protein
MRKRNFAAIAVAALAGFSITLTPGAMGAQIDHDVMVTSDGKGGCTIASIPDDRPQQSTSLVFNVKPANLYEFDSVNGVKFLQKPGLDPIPADEFKRVNSSPTTWTIKDRNKTRGSFGYEVNVKKKADGSACTPLDPTVFNDGNCTEGC